MPSFFRQARPDNTASNNVPQSTPTVFSIDINKWTGFGLGIASFPNKPNVVQVSVNENAFINLGLGMSLLKPR